jgi:2-polyprenyl-6-methoxyphenol hydroxylase-like FAD-dependent oxidoreductase
MQVVIIGASMAGLFAAAACSGAGARVTVLERDVLPGEPRSRPGVPQGLQPHVFLHRGLLAAEQLLPGLDEDIRNAGAVPFDTGDLAWLGEFGWNTRQVEVFEVLSTTRPLLEATVRRRVATHPLVDIRSSVEVVGIAGGAGQWQVRTRGGELLATDLLIDASGRSSRLSTWLAQTGCADARITEIDARIGYATRLYQGDARLNGIPGIIVTPTPTRPTGGAALPAEDGRWLIGGIGAAPQRPPRDAEGFASFLAGLRDPALSALAKRLTPIGDVAVHRQTGNRRHHYEECRDWPDGLLVVGDALCAFNPVYGQGITVAALEALALRTALDDGPGAGWSRTLLRRFAKVIALPWSVATGTDLNFDSCPQNPSRFGTVRQGWADELWYLAAHGNVRAVRTLGGVYHLMMPSWRLAHPALAVAATRRRFGRPPTAVARPQSLPAAPPA